MDTKIRLTRKPFSTALWLVLVTAMTVLLCVGAGLWYSSERPADAIDGLHPQLGAEGGLDIAGHLLQAVNQGISVDEELPGGLGHVQVVL